MEILKVGPHEKSYFVKDLSTNSIYLRNKDQLKLKEGYQSLTVAEAKTVKLISNIGNLVGILKLPRTHTKEWKTVSFCKDVTGDMEKPLNHA